MSGQNHIVVKKTTPSSSKGVFSPPYTTYKPDLTLLQKNERENSISARASEIGSIYKGFTNYNQFHRGM